MKPVVMVTGCSEGGIGYYLCLAFLKAGCKVYVTARNLSSISNLEKPDLDIKTLAVDVTSTASIKAAVDQVINDAGRIDILVNNAGIGYPTPVAEANLDYARQVFDTNYFGLIAMTQAVVPHMAAQRSGKIVNIGSVVGYIASPWGGIYSSSKAAVHNLSDALRLELKPFGIHVTVVTPAAIKTNIGKNNMQRLDTSNLKVFKPFEEAVVARATLSQMPKATPASVFAERVVRKVMQKRPPRYFMSGHQSWLIRFAMCLPLWLRDRMLANRFGLLGKRPVAEEKQKLM